MNREKVLELAQQCQLIGMRPHLDGIYEQSLQQFAALIEREAKAEAIALCERVQAKALEWFDRTGDIGFKWQERMAYSIANEMRDGQ